MTDYSKNGVAPSGLPDAGCGATDAEISGSTVDAALVEELRAARDAAQAASTAKSQFLATVSHEIRTPLNGIIGMAQLLEDSTLTPEQRSYVDAVKLSSGSLLALINDLLDFAKIEAGHLDLQLAETDVGQTVEQLVEFLAPRAHAKGIELVCDIDGSVPAYVAVDRARFRQVMVNLIGNAIKFTDSGGVVVRLRGRVDGTGKTDLIISVDDTGKGISAEDLARIFQEFEQVESADPGAGGGTGLGLAITRRIVRKMGGEIDVTSTAGAGSRFEFSIPSDHIADPAPDKTAAATDQHYIIVSRYHTQGRILAARLQEAGALVTCCGSLEAAVGACQEVHGAGLAVTHVIIGKELDPLSVREAMLQARTTQAFSPAFIVLMPAEDRGKLTDLQAAGFETHLIRPLRREAIRRLVEGTLDGIEPNINHGPDSLAPPIKNHHSRHVLVAEDNEINAILLNAQLAKLGHRITQVENGAAAVAAFKASLTNQDRFDVMLCDLRMPVLNGFETVRAIRAHEQEMSAGILPIFALTADVEPHARQRALDAGFDGVYAKPLDRDVLDAITAGHADQVA